MRLSHNIGTEEIKYIAVNPSRARSVKMHTVRQVRKLHIVI